MKKVTAFLAKLVRVLSIPPVMVVLLVIALATQRSDVYASVEQIIVSVVCLAIIPALAYPVSSMIPSVRKKGRDGQRNLAFVFTAVGYVLGCLYSALGSVPPLFPFIHLTYLFSLLILVFFNRALHIKASGHACSLTGPVGFACLFLGPIAAMLGFLLYATVAWASIHAKRHTMAEFLLGSLSCLLAGGAAGLVTGTL